MTARRLIDVIREEIREAGPMPVARFMALALGHPALGYYATRDPLGRDFTTAPEISQMFGEVIGAWLADAWDRMGRPDPVHLVELGPGRGTLLADALRAAAGLPHLAAAAHLHLVETSPVLTQTQARTLAPVVARHGYRPPVWHTDIVGIPAGPLLAVANEFFDALPVRQLVKAHGSWHERCVALAGDDLAFAPSPFAMPDETLVPAPLRAAPDGAVLELALAGGAIAQQLAGRIAADGGAALIIDYGHTRTGTGDTLQAVRAGAYTDPLADPGNADITTHVDFQALGEAAHHAGAAVFGPVGQGDFLTALGIRQRADALTRAASPTQRRDIASALTRLTAADQMGRLFKAMAIASPGLAVAGFGQ